MRTSLILLVTGLAFAEEPAAPPAAGVSSEAALRALDLPLAAQRVRRAGVPESDVKQALDGMKGAGQSAADADEALVATAESVEKDGPIDNFGAFVQEQLAAGKRGKDLAAAIHAEHEARGKNKGKKDEAEGDDDAKGKGQDKEKGEPKEKTDGKGGVGRPSGDDAKRGGASRPDGDDGPGRGGAGRPGKGGKGEDDDKARGGASRPDKGGK